MKNLVLVLAMMILATGCVVDDWFGGGGGQKWAASTPKQQMSEARNSFDRKIQAAAGKSLNSVQKEWGRLERGLSRDGLTVYQWQQTARVTTPSGEVSKASGGRETLSCLAMFIVNDRDGKVVDATSEGQCYDFSLMPAWKPVITNSTDGRRGGV